MKNNNNIVVNVLCRAIDHSSSIPIIILCIGLFYVLTLVEGQDWTGDFSQYIHHAKNLAEGKHYLDTNYLLTPLSNFAGPYAYPPVYPLLLVPVYWLYGLDLEAMKWVGVISFCLALFFIAKSFSYRLDKRYLLFLLLLVGLNPYIWNFSNFIRTDIPFTLFSYLSLFLMLWHFSIEENNTAHTLRQAVSGVLIGLTMYLAYGTREIGLVLPLTLLTYDIICRKKISIFSVVAVSIFSIFFYLQTIWLSGTFIPEHIQANLGTLTDSVSITNINHFDLINLDFGNIIERIQGYRWKLGDFWPDSSHSFFNTINTVLFNVMTLLAFAGYVISVFKKITVLEIFFVGYIAVLLLFAAPPMIRYLIPIYPLFFYYIMVACQDIFFPRLGILKIWGAGGYLILAGFIYYFAMQEMNYGLLKNGVTHPQAKEMFAFISTKTDINDTIVFKRPRIIALLTGRTAAPMAHSPYDTPPLINDYFDAIEADYYVLMKNVSNEIVPLINSTPPDEQFSEVFRNDYFVIYHYQ